MLHDKLIFIIGAPRSGSTLLQRMLGSHSAIFTHPEPHLLTPLFYLGYYATVDKAPYDHVNAAQALREFCDELPKGEADYLAAVQAYASTLYEKVLAPSGKPYFVDKTPAYALILDFIVKLYPQAKYVVLTRHPLAIMHSYAHSFFGGDYAAAHHANPLLPRYVPAIGNFLTASPVPHVRVCYEDLVTEPEKEMQRVTTYLGLPFEANMVTYGAQAHIAKSFGDPVGVGRHTAPVSHSVSTYARDLTARPDALALMRQVTDNLDPLDLSAWGYEKANLYHAVGKVSAAASRAPRFSTYALKRRALLRLRKNIHHNALGSAVKKLRYACDLLLREM